MSDAAAKVTTTGEARELLPDLDDFFLADLRFASGIRCSGGGVGFGEPTVLARLNREGTWVGLVFSRVERFQVSQDDVTETVQVQDSHGMLEVAILGLQVRCFDFHVLMNAAADFLACDPQDACELMA